jgi:hypothetical protein
MTQPEEYDEIKRTREDITALLQQYGYTYNPLKGGDNSGRIQAWANKIDDDENVLDLGYEDELLWIRQETLVELIEREIQENQDTQHYMEHHYLGGE